MKKRVKEYQNIEKYKKNAPPAKMPEAMVGVNEAGLAKTLGQVNETAKQESIENKTLDLFGALGSAKKRLVVEENNWGPSSPAREDFEIAANVDTDPFRALAGKYWTQQAEETYGFFSPSNKSDPEEQIPFSVLPGKPFYNPMPPHTGFPVGNPFFEAVNQVELVADTSQFMITGQTRESSGYDSKKWKDLIEGNDDTAAPGILGGGTQYTEYRYQAFQISLPASKTEAESLTISGQTYVDVHPEYNFYIKEYENMFNSDSSAAFNVSERILPNLYAVMQEMGSEKKNLHLSNHISLNGTIKPEGFNSLNSSNTIDNFNIKKHSKQYFNSWARGIVDALSGDAGQAALVAGTELTSNKFRNIIIPAKNMDSLKRASEQKEMFPMYVDINVATDTTAELATLMKEMNLLDRFVMHVAKDIILNQNFVEDNVTEVAEMQKITEESSGIMKTEKVTNVTQAEARTWDITHILQKIAMVDFASGAYTIQDFYEENETALEQAVILDNGATEENTLMEPQNKFFQSLMSVVFLGKLKQFMKDRFRTYEDMMKGKLNYSEAVLYRIEKRLVDEEGLVSSEVLQNYWLPNLTEQDVINIVDTQVKYGKRYKYFVYAYQAVLENNYKYSDVEVTDANANFKVTQIPKMKLVEQKIFEEEHMVMDAPPCPPDVQFIPYFGKDDKLLINLNNSVDDYMDHPVIIEFDDVERFSLARDAQKKFSDTEPIRFKSDEALGTFEIFRMPFRPKSWTEFDGHRIARVFHGAFDGPATSSASYVDTLTPNIKYYYMCRVIDAHGHVSNPVGIFEVELVNNLGKIYLSKRTVGLAPVEPQAPSRPMRRLIEIKPALGQTFADVDEDVGSAFNVQKLNMGDEVSLWGKRYKFRFVSKKTGRKLDLNVRFKSKIEKGNPEKE